MENKDIAEKVLSLSEKKDERLYISCYNALELAKNLNIKPIEITRICNKNKIKIKGCQLGCFK